ncbi:hypothetical protein ACFWOG_20435 [Kitasatospora sp. NPDC058406]|uniref:hypothetical protein n=1 Tax=Kitasatospora sp. NPDC058406 TaxID=3346483 RepID=UPI003665914D
MRRTSRTCRRRRLHRRGRDRAAPGAHEAEGVSIDVTGPPDEGITGWFIAEYGTDRSARQLAQALAQVLDMPPLHPFIRMYEHSDMPRHH